MLQGFRDKIQGGLAKVIIILICIPFAFFGIESFFRGGNSPDVAKVGDEAITAAELNEAMELRKRQLMSQMHENLDYSLLEESKLRGPALEQLIDTHVLTQAANHLGLQMSEEQVFNQIIQDPNFQVDGKFSNQKFAAVIQQAGLNEELFVRLLKREALIQQLYTGFGVAEFLTDADVQSYKRIVNEVRDIVAITLPFDKVKKTTTIDEASVKAYYEENKQNYKSQEKVSVDYVLINKKDFIKPVTEEQIKAAYDSEFANFTPAPIFGLSHIEVSFADSDKAAAEQKIKSIQARLAKGESFADVAKTDSDDLGTKNTGGKLGKGKAEVFPEALITAVKDLKAGEVSEPVEIEDSLHLVRLDELKVDKAPSFAVRKASLKHELQEAAAQPEFTHAVETLKDLAFNAPDFEEPAKATNAKIQSLAGLTRQDLQTRFSSPQFIQALYSDEVLQDRQNTDVYEIDEGKYIAGRITQHQLPEVLPYDEVKGKIKQDLLAKKSAEALDEAAKDLLAEIKKAEKTPEQIAKAKGYVYKAKEAVKRNDMTGFDRQVLQAAFSLPVTGVKDKASTDTITQFNGDKTLILVNNVKLGNEAELKDNELKSLKMILSQSKGNNLFEGYQAYLKDHTKVTIK
ncbi:MAG: SurA N-terminal domain-containing protein [Cellvibrionales bacterium]|nr:SurA N-terminal domain-containing protein [Cellvibrionales bacterium]